MNDDSKNSTKDESPPLFKTWKAWYALVLGNLALLIILFYLFTKIFE
jgi:hypothetical protein